MDYSHNDSFAIQPRHYLLNLAASYLRLTVPSQSAPECVDVEDPLLKAYARLLAICLSTNKYLLSVFRHFQSRNATSL